MISGFINCNKPTGLTSSDVVSKIKRLNKGVKIGHLGTLDPGAAGVLPIALGRGTKLFDFLIYKRKYYRAGFVFGVTTDTLDSYGRITERGRKIEKKDIESVLEGFTGVINQVPPQYSACSINGVKAYKLARNAVEFEIKPKKVEVYRLNLIEERNGIFVLDIECSGGTYIRSLCRDIASSLGTVGYMSFLIRISSGMFDIENSKTIEEIERDFEGCLLPLEFPLSGLDRFDVPTVYEKAVKNGVKIPFKNENFVKIYLKGELVGVGREENGLLDMKYVLNI